MNRAIKKRLKKAYEGVPEVICKGLCHESCYCPPMSPEEVMLLEKETRRRLPVVSDKTPGRAVLISDGKCPLLGLDNRCTAYGSRPLICRLYGTVLGMECPHGCKPKRWLSDKEAKELFSEAGLY